MVLTLSRSVDHHRDGRCWPSHRAVVVIPDRVGYLNFNPKNAAAYVNFSRGEWMTRVAACSPYTYQAELFADTYTDRSSTVHLTREKFTDRWLTERNMNRNENLMILKWQSFNPTRVNFASLITLQLKIRSFLIVNFLGARYTNPKMVIGKESLSW